jgi:cob(I)alamin adenosyltransferase
MEQGYFQIYTGNGKGKTTAALGLLIRAVGAGKRVYLGQFIKSMEYHEIPVLRERFPEVTVELYGDEGCIVDRHADLRDIHAARDGLKKAGEALLSGKYDLVILDEIFIALYFNLFLQEDLLDLLDQWKNMNGGDGRRPELVMTGRYAPQAVLDRADLITSMEEIRHYYEKDVEARDGIER